MARSLALLLAIVGFALAYRYIGPVIRRDVVKFRAWRQRVRQWRAGNTAPPAEYRRDNVLWRVRVTALLVSLAAFVVLTALLFAVERPPLGIGSLGALTVIVLLGAAIWGGLAESVR